MKKRYLAIPLAILLAASPLSLAKYRIVKANYVENVMENLSSFISNKPTVIPEVTFAHKLTKPTVIPEVTFVQERPTLEDIDKKERKIYISQEELNSHINYLYTEIRMPKDIPKEIFKNQIYHESRGNIYAKSNVGARGLAQVMPKSWETVEKEIPYEQGVYNPKKNLESGLKILKGMYLYNEKFNPYWDTLDLESKREYTLAAYNWGSRNLRDKAEWDLEKIPNKTKRYIKDVLGN